MSTNIEETSVAPVSTPSPEPSSPPQEPLASPVTPTTPAKPGESARETVLRVANQPPTNRGKHAAFQPRQDGRFAGPPQPPAQQPPPAPVRPEMPKSLKLELKPHWDTAHPDLATAIHQREADFNKGLETYKSKATQLDEILNEFKPYELLLKTEGATPRQAIAPLLQTAAILRTGTPVQKAQAVAQTMRQFGISLEHVHQLLQANGAPAASVPNGAPAIDPYSIQQLIDQRLNAVRAQETQQQATSLIEEMANSPDYKHFQSVRFVMSGLMQDEKFLQKTAGMTEREQLKAAYSQAIWADPDIRTQLLSEQQTKEAADRQAQNAAQVAQARQAAIQTKGAPASGPTPAVDPKNLRALIASQFAQR